MLFDQICGIAEKEIPSLEKKLRDAKLFHFPGVPHEFLPKEIDTEILKFLREQYMLPFNTVAIEDDSGLVIIEDIKPNVKGINQERKFIDIINLSLPDSSFRPDENNEYDGYRKFIEEIGAMDHIPILITEGIIEGVLWTDSGSFLALGKLDGIIHAFLKPYNKKKHIHSSYQDKELDKFSKEILQTVLKSALMNAMTAMQEILYLNTPSRFVVQIAPVKKKYKENNTKIPRSDNRSKYILLEPKEIRRIIQEELPRTQSGRKSPVVHERRAHSRTFHSDKFVNMKGSTIMIPAKWIGVSEKTVGKRIYKVMLNM